MFCEKLGTLATSSTTWRIIQQIDIQPLLVRGKTLIQNWEILLKKCQSPNSVGIRCEQYAQLKEIHQRINTVNNDVTKITDMAQNDRESTRFRRAFMSFVGKASKYLFGTLDEESEIELKALIRETDKKTSEVANLLANQTEIVYKEFGNLHVQNIKMEEAIRDLQQKSIEEWEQERYIMAIQLLEENVIQYEVDVQILTDAILFASEGKVYPHFIDSDQLQKTAKLVSNSVQEAVLPSSTNATSIMQIFRIADISIMLVNQQLIYNIRIPLIDYARYNLIKTTPLPVMQSQTAVFAYIWPRNKYFAVNQNQQNYITVSAEAIDECKRWQDLYICKDTDPTRAITDNSPCEVQLTTTGKLKKLAECDIRIIKLQETFWTRLTGANTWLFSTITEEDLKIKCRRSDDETRTLKGAGILRLSSGCTAHTPTVKITASSSITSTVTSHMIQPTHLNLSQILQDTLATPSDNTTLSIGEITRLIPYEEHNPANTLESGKDLRQIIRKSKELANIQVITSNYKGLTNALSYSGGSLSIIVISLIVIAVIYKTRQKQLRTNNDRTTNRQTTQDVQQVNLQQPQHMVVHYNPSHTPALNLPNIRNIYKSTTSLNE